MIKYIVSVMLISILTLACVSEPDVSSYEDYKLSVAPKSTETPVMTLDSQLEEAYARTHEIEKLLMDHTNTSDIDSARMSLRMRRIDVSDLQAQNTQLTNQLTKSGELIRKYEPFYNKYPHLKSTRDMLMESNARLDSENRELRKTNEGLLYKLQQANAN